MSKPEAPALDDFIASAAAALALPIEPDWQAMIRSNLDVTLSFALSVAAFELPEDIEPAPVFKA